MLHQSTVAWVAVDVVGGNRSLESSSHVGESKCLINANKSLTLLGDVSSGLATHLTCITK